jgi:hypothetical protein
MSATKEIPRSEWESYFERFTQQHLKDEGGIHKVAIVEVLSPELGDQFEATMLPLDGISYDPKSNALELALEGLDHLIFQPAEIWVVEEENGFVPTLEVVRSDGIREIVQLQQSGPPALRYETLPGPQN